MLHKRKIRLNIGKGKIIQSAVFVAILIYLLGTLYTQQDLLEKTTEEYNQAAASLELEKEKNLELQQDFAALGTDEFYEKVAREVFGYVRAGEKVFYESKN